MPDSPDPTADPAPAPGATLGTLTVAGRFCGPPTSGNGGYTAGLAAGHLAPGPDEAVEVRLHLPPPLDRALVVTPGPDEPGEGPPRSVRVLDGDAVVVSARVVPWAPDPDARPAATWDEATAAAVQWSEDDHPFPTCFVCGPARTPGDGLRIFAAPLPERGSEPSPTFGATWVPTEISAARIWAALDCPGGQAVSVFGGAESAVVLGTIVARHTGDIEVGRRYVLTSWERAHEGRKHLCTALLSDAESGTVVGESHATWIAVPRS